ncbi:class I SAM-dependent methyltransferase [Streptomyces sp. NPDC006739]|uniref:class I SAM-dependent methyltransferase n=1 Tax=Streptomyces sp. NPDC006739 TaxID=3364763 RepID=UPI0036CC474D
MTALPPRLIRAMNRFNAAHPWDHNAHYHGWLIRQLPRRPLGRALDVGCGSGDLVRLLASRPGAVEVHGIDSDARIIEQAERAEQAEEAGPGGRTVYSVADAPHRLPAGPHDLITCLAVLHHLPFADSLTRFREELAPGGTLVVVGCAREDAPLDQLLSHLSLPLNLLVGWAKNRGRADTAPGQTRPVSMTAATRAPEMTFAQIAAGARRILPGARLRRRLFWRYTLVWRAPVAEAG